LGPPLLYTYIHTIERLAARNNYLRNSTKHNIIGEDLSLPYADWNVNAECTSGNQAFVNRLVWENGYMQVVDSVTRGDALLNVYLVRAESSFTSCSTVEGIKRPLWGIIRWGMGRKLLCTASRKTNPGIP
jgi:hypothetical protein